MADEAERRAEAERVGAEPAAHFRPHLERAYYHGLVPRADVAELLTKPGDFLLRFQLDENDQVRPCLSVRVNGELHHADIRTNNGKVSVDGGAEYGSIDALIADYRREKRSVSADTAVYLSKPAKRQRWQLRNKNFCLSKMLGAGSFGKVYKGVHVTRNRERTVAIKICYGGPGLSKEKMLEEVMREARVMRPLKHRHVVRVFGVAMDYEPIMIVMEYVRGGSLQRHLRKNAGNISMQDKVERMILGAACGLEYIHFKKCKISDFGLARMGDSYRMTAVQKVAFKHMAPETFLKFVYTPKTDVYAFGVLVWEILADGREPYAEKRLPDVRNIVTAGARLEFAEDVHESLKSIVRAGCWCADPADRDNMAKILARIQQLIRKLNADKAKARPYAEDEVILEPGMAAYRIDVKCVVNGAAKGKVEESTTSTDEAQKSLLSSVYDTSVSPLQCETSPDAKNRAQNPSAENMDAKAELGKK